VYVSVVKEAFHGGGGEKRFAKDAFDDGGKESAEICWMFRAGSMALESLTIREAVGYGCLFYETRAVDLAILPPQLGLVLDSLR
jgi:hypothetical protein